MNQILLIIPFFFFFNVKAQDPSNHPTPHLGNPLHPRIAVVIGILSVMFSLTFLILAYAKFCSTMAPNHLPNEHNPPGLPRSRSKSSGIDKNAIESLPFFRFSSLKGSKEGLECVVCLSKFEDSEILRLLPKCRHAFHMTCIDKWLESHSSCPLCRYKFDVGDVTNFTYTNSLRYTQNHSNLAEGSNFEIFIRREQDNNNHNNHRSSRFNLGSSFRKFGRIKKEELLIEEDGNSLYGDDKLLHKFKHKIIVSDIVYKSRWSDVNSSDLLFLNSEMLNVTSSKRFSPLSTNSGGFENGLDMNEHIVKIKEDMERKRLYDTKVGKITRSNSVSTSNFHSVSTIDGTSRSLNRAEKRSMSEITNLSRFRELSTRNRIKESLFSENSVKDERMRRVWLPIARRTVQWFAGRERSSVELSNALQFLSMERLGAIVVIISFLFFHANAKKTPHPVDPSLAAVISILSAIFFVIFLIVLYTKFCHTYVPDILTIPQNLHGLLRSSSRLLGMDKRVIESLPFFTFSSLNGSKEGLECVVCLSRFEENEILRLLPICRHAFHMKCIDKWLESHSSCPLCRYRFDVHDLTNFTYMTSLRYHPDLSNLTDNPNREIFVQREEHQSSTRFSFRKFGKIKKDEPLILGGSNSEHPNKLLHNFKHKIIVSDIVCRSRWSDMESSDFLFLNSEMLNVVSSKRFSASKITRSNSFSTSNIEVNPSTTSSRLLNPTQKRSMSEIADFPRFTNYIVRDRIEESLFSGNGGKDEKMRRLWLSIARRTVHWFSGEEISLEESESKRYSSNV